MERVVRREGIREEGAVSKEELEQERSVVSLEGNKEVAVSVETAVAYGPTTGIVDEVVF